MERLCYSLTEASELTSLSVFSIKRQIRRGNLRVSRIGRRVVITAADLERFIRTGTTSAKTDGSRECGD